MLDLVEGFGNNLYKHEVDKRVRLYLANREVVVQLIYLVLNGQVGTSFELFDLAHNAAPSMMTTPLRFASIFVSRLRLSGSPSSWSTGGPPGGRPD